jgi:hypothetical protein
LSVSVADVLHGAREQREKAEARLKIYTWLSYFLFVVGWFVSILGKTYEFGEPGT